MLFPSRLASFRRNEMMAQRKPALALSIWLGPGSEKNEGFFLSVMTPFFVISSFESLWNGCMRRLHREQSFVRSLSWKYHTEKKKRGKSIRAWLFSTKLNSEKSDEHKRRRRNDFVSFLFGSIVTFPVGLGGVGLGEEHSHRAASVPVYQIKSAVEAKRALSASGKNPRRIQILINLAVFFWYRFLFITQMSVSSQILTVGVARDRARAESSTSFNHVKAMVREHLGWIEEPNREEKKTESIRWENR